MSDGVFNSVYWINCATIDAILLDFETLAKLLTSVTAQFPSANAVVQYVMKRLSGTLSSWLLVFDNLDVPNVFQHIRAYIPRPSANGSILYISRHADTARLGTPWHLDVMTKQEAVQLLLGESQTTLTDAGNNHAKAIVAALVTL
jgi:hypothetical protein